MVWRGTAQQLALAWQQQLLQLALARGTSSLPCSCDVQGSAGDPFEPCVYHLQHIHSISKAYLQRPPCQRFTHL
jgi:hypothetical protein